VWVGTFTAVVVSQFWSFAADVYSNEAGRRVFPFIGLGASAGGMAASWAVAHLLAIEGWSSAELLPLAALLLVAAAAVAQRAGMPGGEAAPAANVVETPFINVLRSRYLTATMGLIVVLNWVSTNGENLLFGVVQESIRGELGANPALAGEALRAVIADRTSTFYGGFFFWTNLLTLLLQVAITSRLHRRGGSALGLMLLPLLALASYSLMALMPMLAIMKVMRVAERATAYSVQSTTGQLLWLPAPARMKYEAKLLIDTVGVRFGDGLSAATMLLGIGWLGLSLNDLLAVNLVLIGVWLCLGATVSQEHKRLAQAGDLRSWNPKAFAVGVGSR
jgi:AAA family ATP:ADP antiporter